jgi:hypothetical protein
METYSFFIAANVTLTLATWLQFVYSFNPHINFP